MTLPAPRPGLVIHYAFLWSQEKQKGAEEGAKGGRPSAIIVAAPRGEAGDIRVVVVPITHARPSRATPAIEIPKAVASSLGLDDERHWIILTELNSFMWPGFDIRPIPGTKTEYVYGMLPQPLFENIRAKILLLDEDGKAGRPISRD